MLMVRPRLRRSKGTLVPIRSSGRLPKGLIVEKQALAGFSLPPKCWPGRYRRACLYNDSVPFTIQDFRPTDFDALWRIDQECFPPGISYSRAELRAYMRRRGSFTLVAVGNGIPTGVDSDSGTSRKYSSAMVLGDGSFAGFIVAEADNRASGHIITIDVVNTARRSGVGSLLLRAAEDRLRGAGCRSVELETAVDNLSALSFYKRHGYTVITTFPRYYSNGVDALVLEKPLTGK
jgi:[ribosomal protein S18]-alanine N-acetyltransferase